MARVGGKKTVIRGGYGIFYTGDLLNPIRDQLMTRFPFMPRRAIRALRHGRTW